MAHDKPPGGDKYPNLTHKGFKGNPEKAAAAGKVGGAVKSAKTRILDSITDGEIEAIKEMRELYIKAAKEKALEGDFKMTESWSSMSGQFMDKRKEPEEVKEDTNKLDININITGEDPKE